MSRREDRAYDRKAMLAAFRQQRGPRGAAVDSLWERLVDEAVTRDGVAYRAPGGSRVLVVLAVAGALAAAFVLGWWLRGAPLWSATVAEPANMANRDREEERAEGQANARRSSGVGGEPSGVTDPESNDAGRTVDERARPAPADPLRPRRSLPPKTAPSRTSPPSSGVEPVPPAGTLVETLVEETALIRRVRRALAQDDDAEALRLVTEYRKRFPNGTLVEEADALHSMARCRVQPDRRAALRGAFLSKYPGSMQQSGVDRACAE